MQGGYCNTCNIQKGGEGEEREEDSHHGKKYIKKCKGVI
jgi:hypothetical protein